MELWLKVVHGRKGVHPAATVLVSDCTSIPSWNGTPSMTCPSLRNPRSLRQRDSAHWPSLNIMASMVSRLKQPRVRWRIVAKVDSIGLVARMLCQCSAGKSKKFIRSLRSWISFTAALGYFSWQRAGNGRRPGRPGPGSPPSRSAAVPTSPWDGWPSAWRPAHWRSCAPGSAGAEPSDRPGRAPTGTPMAPSPIASFGAFMPHPRWPESTSGPGRPRQSPPDSRASSPRCGDRCTPRPPRHTPTGPGSGHAASTPSSRPARPA